MLSHFNNPISNLAICLNVIEIICLQVNFEDEARVKFLKLLGFSKDELERKVCLQFMYKFTLLSKTRH